MKSIALIGIAFVALAPTKAATLQVNAHPSPNLIAFSCVAPRAPLQPDAFQKYEYIANAVVTGIPEGENSSIQRKDLRVYKFLKGRFSPLRIRAYFSYMCGPGGPEIKVDDRLKLYMMPITDRKNVRTVSVDHWRPLSFDKR